MAENGETDLAVDAASRATALLSGRRDGTRTLDMLPRAIADAVKASLGVQCQFVAIQRQPNEPGGAGPIHAWPDERLEAPQMAQARRHARQTRLAAVAGRLPGQSDPAQPTHVVVPVLTPDGGALIATLGVELRLPDGARLDGIVDLLHLVSGWIAEWAVREAMAFERRRAEMAGRGLSAVAVLAEAQQFRRAARALVTELAERFGLERASFGLTRHRRTRVVAISHVVKLSRAQTAVRALEAAMDEALDQERALCWPSKGQDDSITIAQRALLEGDAARTVLTAPMWDGESYCGAFVFETGHGRRLQRAEMEALEAIVALLTPIILEKRQNSRDLLTRAALTAASGLSALIGRRHFAAKAGALAAVLLVATLVLVERPYAVRASARVEGLMERTIAAPFDGFIASAPARQGDTVEKGELLVRLDDRELILESFRLQARAAEIDRELDQAIGAARRADARILAARRDDVAAQAELIDERLRRTQMLAPFDALVVSGDLSRAIGRSVREGEPLLTVSPRDAYRIRLAVDQRVIDDVRPGQEATLRMAARPDSAHLIRIRAILPTAEHRDGRTFFPVEADFVAPPGDLLHGMEGAARIDVEARSVGRIWFEPLYRAVRQWLWAHGPL